MRRINSKITSPVSLCPQLDLLLALWSKLTSD